MAYPTSIEAATYFQTAYNNLSTTLTAVCGISDTTVYVSSTDNFPSIGWITIEDEIRSYTGKTAGSFTGCTPGAQSTTAAEHASGTAVSLTLTAEPWNNLITELRATQTAVGTSGSYNFVSVTGTQTVAGVKTFTSFPVTTSTVPTTAYQVANKAYVDTKALASASTTSAATHTPTIASEKTVYNVTSQAAAAAFAAPSGTATDGYALLIRVKDNATFRALSWDSAYTSGTATMKTSTTTSTRSTHLFVYDGSSTKWECEYAANDV